MKLKTLLVVMSFTISLIPIVAIWGIQGFKSDSMFLIALIAIVTFIISLVMAYLISRPIERLTRNIDEISKGNLDVKLENSEISEVNRLTFSLNSVMASLKLAIHKVGVKKGEIFEETVKEKQVAEEKYRGLLDSINGWAWEVDAKGILTFVSKNISSVLGYKSSEVVGKSIFNFMNREDAKNAKLAFNEASKNKGSIKKLENWNVRKNGKKVCMMTNGVPIFDDAGNLVGYRGVDLDITETKFAQIKIDELNSELLSLKERVTKLLNTREKVKTKKKNHSHSKNLEDKWSEHDFDSVYIFDQDANILDCNDKMYKQLGYTKAEMLSLNIADFDALESKKDILCKIDEVKKSGCINFKTIHKRKNGSAILVSEHIEMIDGNNRFKCVVREDKTMK